MTTAETDEDWMEEMLVLTHEAWGAHKGAPVLVQMKPTSAGDLIEVFSDEGNCWAILRSDIKAVAQNGGERTAFVNGHRYQVRRATRAEALGQEDRLHEEDEDAPDVFSLREQLDEALDMLAEAAAPGGIGPHEFSRPGGYRERVIAILAKHGRKTD